MGSANSVLLTNSRIDVILPHHTFELARDKEEHANLIKDVTPIFPGGHHDRMHFIESLRVLLSSNGQILLDGKHFKLVFSRPEQDQYDMEHATEVYASVVATSRDGTIVSKVVSDRAGRDKIEALQLLRTTVEVHMHKLLEEIPDAIPNTASVLGARNGSNVSLATTLPDEPPPYERTTVK